jgi:hypothetical protein
MTAFFIFPSVGIRTIKLDTWKDSYENLIGFGLQINLEV